MRKIEIPITILVMVGIVLFVLFFNKGTKNDNVEEKEVLGVVNTFYTEYDINDAINDGEYFLVSDGNYSKEGVIDGQGNLLINIEYTDIRYLESGYFILMKKFGDECLVDASGKEYLSGFRINSEYIDDKYYYIVSEADDNIVTGMRVYNDSFEEIGYYKNVYSSFGKYLYGSNALINYLTGESYEFDKNIANDGDYLIFAKENEAYLINKETKELKYVKNFKDNEGETYTIDGKTESYFHPFEKLELNDDYYVDIDIENDRLFLYDKKNNKKYNDVYFHEIDDGVYLIEIFSTEEDNIKTMLFFKDGSVIETQDEGYISYIDNIVFYKDNDGINYYNYDGDKLDLQCDMINSAYDDNYVCTRDKKDYLIDKDYKDISDGYDKISCVDKICVIGNDGLYGALYNGEKIIDLTFPNLSPNSNYLTAENKYDYKTRVIVLGKDNIIDDLAYEESGYKELDVDKVIKDYSLEDVRKEIEDNKEFFQKYANLVTNNENLAITLDGNKIDYKKHVFDMFKVVIKHKGKLDEEYFLDCLKKLTIRNSEKLDNNIAGHFASSIVTLVNPYVNTDFVIYHELMHFVDYSIAKDDDLTVLTCDGKNIGFVDIDEKVGNSCYGNGFIEFMSEPGAELYTSIYLLDYYTHTYYNGLQIYGALSYLFGYDVMEDIYFDPNSNRKLYELLSGVGMSKEDFINFEDVAFNSFGVGEEYNEEMKSYLLKYLVDIYKYKKGTEWYNDKEYMFILNGIFNHDELKEKIVGSEILSKYNANYNFGVASKLLDKYKNLGGMTYINYGGKSYIKFYYFVNGTKEKVELVEYDFNNNKILNSRELKEA